MNQETGSNYVQMSVGNVGNTLTRASGTLRLTGTSAGEVFTAPFEIGTVLPADGTFVRVDAPLDPGSGDYTALVTLRHPDGREVTGAGAIALRQKRENGCAAASEGSPATAVARRPRPAPIPSDAGGPPWITIGLGALAALFALLLILSLRRRRRTERTEGL